MTRLLLSRSAVGLRGKSWVLTWHSSLAKQLRARGWWRPRIERYEDGGFRVWSLLWLALEISFARPA